MHDILSRFFIKTVIATSITILAPAPVYAAESFKSWFTSEKENPNKKLMVICPEITSLDLSHAHLHTNTAVVSPTTFNHFFSQVGDVKAGYLRSYDEYKKMKEDREISLQRAQKIIFVKPFKGLPDNVIAMNQTLRAILIRSFGKNPDIKTTEISFISIIGEILDPSNQVKVDLKITTQESLKRKNIEIFPKVIEHQLQKKFQNIPLTPIFNGLTFTFTHQELSSIPQILDITATLRGYSNYARMIDIGTSFVMTVEDHIKLERYAPPPSLSFTHLIKTSQKDIMKRSSSYSVPYGDNSWTNSPLDLRPIVSLEEFLATTEKPIIPEPSGPQIKNVNLNFKDLGIGGLDDQLNELVRRSIKTRCVDQEVLDLFDIKEHNKGIILYGPPGNGKTLIARKMAEMLGVPDEFFIVINGAEILSKYVGESEENLRKIFAKAEQNPSKLVVIFFDEIDALASRRTTGTGAGDKVNNNLVNQLLTKMDGVKRINNILVIGATNRPDVLDPALLRPGRFDIQINIKLPDAPGRKDIFQIHLKRVLENGVLKDIDMEQLVAKTQNFTGAEIAGLCHEARSFALRDASDNPEDLSSVNRQKICITMNHFLAAFNVIHPAFGQDISSSETHFPDYSLSLASQNKILNMLLYNLESFRPGKVYSLLIKGSSGSGKSALLGRLANKTKSYFDLTRVIYSGLAKKSFTEQLEQAWQDALNVDNSLIILDGLENLVKMLNVYKYDERAMISLNSLLTSPIKKKVVVLATMAEEAAELFQQINPMLKWSVQTQVPSLSQEDMGEILQSKGIKEQSLIELLSDIPLTKVLDILTVENASTYSKEQWKRRISFLR